MKNTNFKTLTLLLLSIFLLSFTTNRETFQTECVSLETQGYVTLKIWNPAKGRSYTSKQAQKDAILVILYSGISGGNGCISQPPILNNSTNQDKFKSIEKKFFSTNGKWINFTRSSTIETTMSNAIGEMGWKVYQITISRDELQKYLQEKQIINSLNSAF